MKLYRIETSGPLLCRKYSASHWILDTDYHVHLFTDCGVLKFTMLAGWITDFRSGSRAVDVIVPKRGNKTYTASVLCHDMAYSGWIGKDLADELLYQGMVLSGQSKWRAGLAYKAVRWFGDGGYYDLKSTMPWPYEKNRQLEKFEWKAM